jgi:hypothetical protein
MRGVTVATTRFFRALVERRLYRGTTEVRAFLLLAEGSESLARFGCFSDEGRMIAAVGETRVRVTVVAALEVAQLLSSLWCEALWWWHVLFRTVEAVTVPAVEAIAAPAVEAPFEEDRRCARTSRD